MNPNQSWATSSVRQAVWQVCLSGSSTEPFHAADGGSFGEGFENGAAATIEIGAEFGDKHGGKIVRKLVTGILFGVGVDIADDLF